MQNLGQVFLVLLALVVSAPARADLTGKVVGVTDGDTITVLDSNKQLHKIRLAGISAPKRGQPFGFRSKEHLAKWVYDREVFVEGNRKDSGGRLLGTVFVDGHDAGLEQIRAGLAWWDRACANEQTADDRAVYELAQAEASKRKLRLWRDTDPVPPWEWQRSSRSPKD